MNDVHFDSILLTSMKNFQMSKQTKQRQVIEKSYWMIISVLRGADDNVSEEK